MKTQKRIIWFVIPLMAAFWFSAANSSSVTVIGTTVKDGGSTEFAGLTAGPGGMVKYYIPLNSSNTGIYGVTNSTSCGVAGVGTCSDSGSGFGYDDASGLKMNIFFDLSWQPQSASAKLDFVFDDLDLTDINDPYKFFESMSLSYWNGSAYAPLGSTIKNSGDMAGDVDVSATDPITWNLDLASILVDLNNSQTNDDGFWIQLGFGSKYDWSGRNTPEYLTSSLTVSSVPVPAAVWLFGTALIGFVGMSRRTVVT